MSFQDESKVDEQKRSVTQRMTLVKKVIVVMSGKGGVGKTSVSVNLAQMLAAAGNSVGLLDTDFHGPNVAKMLGIEDKTVTQNESDIEPVLAAHGLKVISAALLGKDKDAPFIWRGPMKAAAIRQFLGDVNWGNLDYMIIDSPPGTGDEPLSVCQLLPDITSAIIVTTPQDVSILDARKSISFAKELNIPILGLIENMNGVICPQCRFKIQLFKKGGGQKAAEEMGVPFLGSLPFDLDVVELGDTGGSFVLSKPDAPITREFKSIVNKIQVSE